MIVFDRHGAPAEERLSLFADDAGDEMLEAEARARICGKEDGARAIAALGRKVDPQPGRDLPQKTIWRLDQNAGAVPRVSLAPARAAVLQVDQDLQAALDHRMRAPACHIDDEPDTTGVVFEGWVV
jgi:hypothetical protein